MYSHAQSITVLLSDRNEDRRAKGGQKDRNEDREGRRCKLSFLTEKCATKIKLHEKSSHVLCKRDTSAQIKQFIGYLFICPQNARIE